MPFDFPNSPTNGQQVTGPNGAVYTWDGVKWTTSTAASPYVLKAGDTMTGALVLPANATTALQAVPKQQLDAAVGPLASTAYVQAAVAPALNDVGRNLLHNGLFNVAQRGAGPWTTNGAYTLDRWANNFSADTMSTSVVALADADRAAIGDESALNAVQIVFTGTAGASALTIYQQAIEGVRRLGNKTVTASFWARATAGTPKIGISVSQNFGTGGSPGASTNTNIGVTAALTTAWMRYSITGSFPSTVGKALGTNNNDNAPLQLWLSCPSANTQWYSASGNLGQQSGTIQLWGVQLEIGSVATPLEKIDPGDDLRRCQRFYQSGAIYLVGYSTAAQGIGSRMLFPVTMRSTPTIGFINQAYTNASALATASVFGDGFGFWATVTAQGVGIVTAGFTASADL